MLSYCLCMLESVCVYVLVLGSTIEMELCLYGMGQMHPCFLGFPNLLALMLLCVDCADTGVGVYHLLQAPEGCAKAPFPSCGALE